MIESSPHAELVSRASIRQLIRKKRNALTRDFQQKSANELLAQLQNDDQIKQAKHIALYLANDGELDLTPFIQWCWQQEKSVYLPRVHPFSKGNLIFLLYTKTSSMVLNQYNILEPKLDVRTLIPVEKLDIILTPLVAFDPTGARIGMGGGYYDRTLSKWYKAYIQNEKCKPYPIGVAHECQQVHSIPVELWDIPLPQIMTPVTSQRFNIPKLKSCY